MATVLDRKKGSVKWFDGQKGFGFIMPGDGGDDVFVHRSSVKAIGFISLAKGENVEFSIEVREDGRRSAVNVTGPCGAYLHGPCFSCGEFGHLARDCVLSNGGCRGVGPCFSCGGMGHLFRQCPARLKCFELPSPSPCPCERCSHDSQLSQTICGTSLPDFSLEEDFRINAPGEWRQCWESIGLVEEEEQDSEEDAEEEFSIGDDEEERKSIFGEQRNWAELPRDVLSLIFKKIAAIEILTSAQFVCRTWQQLSHEPEIWRCIDMTDVEPDWTHDMKSVAVEAVDRSKGCLEEFYLGYFGDDELMLYIADRTTVLRCLRLMSVPHISEEGLAEALGRCHMFNELEISLCFFEDVVVELVGKACPRLKSFSLNAQPYRFADNSGYDSDWNQDEAALAIAKHMQQLTRLQLIGNPLTNDGLHAILDNCRCLEYLDIRRCLYVNLDENLNRKCARIKVLRLPDDSVADFHMDVTIGGLESPPEDYDSDIGFFGFENDLYSVMSYEDYFDDFWF